MTGQFSNGFRTRSRRCEVDGSRDRQATQVDPPYSSLAEVYDFLIGNSALPLIQSVFSHSVSRFALDFRSLADIGCGTGAFLSTFACRSIELIGVDRSGAVLVIARRRFGGCPVTLLRQDIRRLSLPHSVDLITCQYQTLNYLTIATELGRAFSAVARNLRCGGTFLFDFLARTPAMMRVGPRRIRESIGLPDHQVDFDAVVDPPSGKSNVRIRVWDNLAQGRPAIEVHRQQWFKPTMVVRLLHASGFHVCDIRPVHGSDNAWLHVVAKRV
jgi:SAM-dependent methyltransferase